MHALYADAAAFSDAASVEIGEPTPHSQYVTVGVEVRSRIIMTACHHPMHERCLSLHRSLTNKILTWPTGTSAAASATHVGRPPPIVTEV